MTLNELPDMNYYLFNMNGLKLIINGPMNESLIAETMGQSGIGLNNPLNSKAMNRSD